MSSQSYLTDAATRRAVFLQRYIARQHKVVDKQLRMYKGQLSARLLEDEFVSRDFDGLVGDMRQLQMLDQASFVAEARELALSEALFTAAMLTVATSAVFKAPTDALLTTALSSAVPVQGGVSIPQILSAFDTKKAADVLKVITDAATTGKSTPSIVKQVSSLIESLIKRQAQALISTILSHASSAGRLATYEQNSDLVDQYQWVSTLDGLTSMICMGRDGKRYDIGIGPMPPAHFNCRSTTIPIVKPKYSLDLKGQRPAIGADGTELVSSKTRYSGWLRNQPKSFIDEALGPARSKLFREGKVTLDRFTDPTGKSYTLSQLDSMNNIALSAD